ncbi:Hpt domain-containing protein [Maritimibacter sp. DP1N21-5]|nr:Hpt domain-containing protein [Maritimibacter sp. DP1N21-5]
MFMDEVDETIAKLQSAPHPRSLEEDLHFIRSAALNIGFADLARACQEGESAAAARQEVDLAGLFALYHASRAAFANLP